MLTLLGTSAYTLSDAEKVNLESIANSDGEMAPGLAKSILSVYGKLFEPEEVSLSGSGQFRRKATASLVKEEILVYPNPADGELTFQWTDKTINESRLEIINSSGQKMASHKIPVGVNSIQIETHTLPTGLFFYQLYISNDLAFKGRVVIQK